METLVSRGHRWDAKKPSKSSDAVYKYKFISIFQSRPKFFQLSVSGSLKQRKRLDRKPSKCPRPLARKSAHKNESIQSLCGSLNEIL